MRRYKLIAGARKDLLGIWSYTFDTWGEAQADAYLHTLWKKFDAIGSGEVAGKRPVASNARLRSVRCEHHYIFFLTGDKQGIVHIRAEMYAKPQGL